MLADCKRLLAARWLTGDGAVPHGWPPRMSLAPPAGLFCTTQSTLGKPSRRQERKTKSKRSTEKRRFAGRLWCRARFSHAWTEAERTAGEALAS